MLLWDIMIECSICHSNLTRLQITASTMNLLTELDQVVGLDVAICHVLLCLNLWKTMTDMSTLAIEIIIMTLKSITNVLLLGAIIKVNRNPL